MNSYNISFTGAVDSGKSTLISVLKNKILDDGKGAARKKVVKHNHELVSGRTSCVSYNTTQLSQENIFTFIDLAGNEKYLKNNIYDLNLNLNAMFLIIGANNGISIMTKEHFNLSRALHIPIIIIINKIDICPENILNNTLNDLIKLTGSKMGGHKSLYFYENKDLIDTSELFINNKFDTNANIVLKSEKKTIETNDINFDTTKYYPVFFASCKTGYGIDNLKYFLNNYFNNNNLINTSIINTSIIDKSSITIDNIFIIQETYHINGVGIVFYGHVKQGMINKNQKLNIGPFGTKFYPINIRNIRDVLDNDVESLYTNQSGCLLIKQLSKDFTFRRNHIRKGIYITNNPFSCQEFIWK